MVKFSDFIEYHDMKSLFKKARENIFKSGLEFTNEYLIDILNIPQIELGNTYFER